MLTVKFKKLTLFWSQTDHQAVHYGQTPMDFIFPLETLKNGLVGQLLARIEEDNGRECLKAASTQLSDMGRDNF